MAHITGSFAGYREFPAPLKNRRPALFLPVKRWTNAPTWFQLEQLGPIPYESAVFAGEAGDAFPASFTLFPFFARAIQCSIRAHSAEIIFTYDGQTALPMLEFDQNFVRMQGTWGFMIRNRTPGLVARYQVVPLR